MIRKMFDLFSFTVLLTVLFGFTAGCQSNNPFSEEEGCTVQPMPDGGEWIKTCVEEVSWKDKTTLALSGYREMSPERKSTDEFTGESYVDFPPIYMFLRVFDQQEKMVAGLTEDIIVVQRAHDFFEFEGVFAPSDQKDAEQAHTDPDSLVLRLYLATMDRGPCPYAASEACASEIDLDFSSFDQQ